MCDQIKQLIKAHAIPRKFFEGIRGTGNYSVLIDANKPLKADGTYYQAGTYDNEILCEDCEKKFSDFDNYGWQILGKPSLANPLRGEATESFVDQIDLSRAQENVDFFHQTRLPTSASHCNPTGFVQIPDFGRAIRNDRLDSHLLGFIHVTGYEVQAD
jgi:hypothetical protein